MMITDTNDRSVSAASDPTGGARVRRSPRRWLLRVGSVVLICLLLGAIGFWWFWLRLPVGSGPAGPSVAREPFERIWTARPVLLLGLGDSITDGLGARKGWSYFDRLLVTPPEELEDVKGLCLSAVMPNLRATNVALSGSTSLQHWEKEFRRLPKTDSNTLVVVTLTTGGNDLIQRYGLVPPREGAMYGATLDQAQPWVANFEQRLERMIQRLNNEYPSRCEIFLGNIYDPTDGSGKISLAQIPHWPDGPRLLRAYNDIIERCAQRHTNVHLVNLHDVFLGHGFRCAQFWSEHYRRDDPHYWYYLNIEDPNERGYDAIRRLFLNEMIRTLAPH